MSEIKIAVPHGKFSIRGFDSKSERLIDVPSSVTCHRDFDDDRNVFQSCWLHGSWKTKAHESSLFELTHSRYSVDIESRSKEIKAYDQIHSANIHLQYNGESESSLKFNLVNKTNN